MPPSSDCHIPFDVDGLEKLLCVPPPQMVTPLSGEYIDLNPAAPPSVPGGCRTLLGFVGLSAKPKI
jgi:hypothetical protein